MDDKLILQPNWHSEIYRTLTPKLDVTTLYKYLDFIEISDDGHVLIGSSNLTGRTWYGSVWYYENIDLCYTSNLTTYVANKTLSSGCVDGKFIKSNNDQDNKMIICDDSGCIQVLRVPENGDELDDKLQLYKLSEEHESIITNIELFKTNHTHFITCSMDLSIKIWDLEYTRVESNEYLNSLKTYNSAHSDTITSIDTHLTNDNIFVSCSLDQHVLLWDQRTANANESKEIYLNEFNGLTSIKWYPNKQYDYLLNVTSDNGSLYTIDLRQSHSYLYKLQINADQSSIYKIKYNNNDKYLLSVCGDNTNVVVLDMNNLYLNLDHTNIIYTNHTKHTDFIRGLAWTDNDTLITCGWDQKIYKHSICNNNTTLTLN